MEKSFKIIVLEGPSGVGKDTLMNDLINFAPNKYKKIVSYTNRPKRPCEVEGREYHFIDTETFLKKIDNGDIFEHTTRHGTYRGMSRTIIDNIINSGFIAIKDVDVVGKNALKKAYPNIVKTIFLTADKDIVKKRLLKRGGSDIDIETRLKDYDHIHKHINEYDHIIKNNGTPDIAFVEAKKLLEE